MGFGKTEYCVVSQKKVTDKKIREDEYQDSQVEDIKRYISP
jgi:hypothetical protein